MLENIRLAFQGIWSHKMRSFLTMLGIIIGIASIISIVSTIRGTSEMLKQNLCADEDKNNAAGDFRLALIFKTEDVANLESDCGNDKRYNADE